MLPADKAGLVENDIIIAVDGTPVTKVHSLASLIRRYTVGETVSLKILHNGEEKTVSITLEKAHEDL